MTDSSIATALSCRAIAGIPVAGMPRAGECVSTDWLPVAPFDTYRSTARDGARPAGFRTAGDGMA